MAAKKRSRGKRLVLDVGSSAVRVCELSQTKAGYQVTRYAQREIPVTPSMAESDREAATLTTLRTLLKELKIRHKKTVFAVPGQSVFTRTRALPPVPEHKVTQIVRYEIQQQIPFSLDQIALDYQVLNRTEAGGYEVLMAAIKVDVVEKHVNIINALKRTIDTVDVAPIAAYNWLKHAGEFGEEGECVALVDIGAATTEIVIERDNQFRFTRSLNLGGNNITTAIAEGFNLSWEDAEKVKRERGFAPTGDAQRDGKGGEVIGKVLKRLVSELNRSISFFRTQPGGGTVSRIVLTGGCACLRNIVPYLQKELGIEVRIAQPLAGLAIGPGAQQVNEHPEQAATVLGLALRTQESAPIEINLIPPRILELARAKEQTLYWALSITTLALIMASIIPIKANENKIVNENIAVLEKHIENYDPALLASGGDVNQQSAWEAQLQAEQATVNQFNNQLTSLVNAYNNRNFWLDLMVLIAEARPAEGIWISSFETCRLSHRSDQPVIVNPVFDEEEVDEKFNFGNVGTAQGQGQASATNRDDKLVVAGFPGLYPVFANAPRGMPGQPGQGEGEPTAPAEPNAVSIVGYAKDDATVQHFIQRLKETGKFVEVYFSPGSASLIDMNVLGSATTKGAPKAQAQAITTFAEEEEDSPTSFGGGFGGGGTSLGGSRATYAPTGISVVSFEIQCQFAGQPIDRYGDAPAPAPPPLAIGGGAPAAAAGGDAAAGIQAVFNLSGSEEGE